jgi:hypothetical protein
MNWMLLTADAVLFLHVLFVGFVVLGQVLILLGGGLGWAWVRNFRFRVLHLLAIGIVVAQAWLGILCPLTILEMELRERGGGEVYYGTFIGHWLDELLYVDAPLWVFTVAYTAFGLLVAGSWFRFPPRRKRR